METDSGLLEIPSNPEEETEEPNEFDQLIELILDLDPAKYAGHWSEVELQKMREIISAGRTKFPKKVIPYVELMRKFLFANFQLIAMAALAHQTAASKKEKEEQLVKPASFADLNRIETEKLKNG